ncbi:MAG TPA: DUF2723 domain-containing protein [Candidatus Eisenbacteria bacterium]|nr:DUF2723 domain-containing protein [Candidatus Eisenbacteria bacterium]
MRRSVALEAFLAAGASGALYLRTLAPGVGSGDSGELLLAADSLGVPHPPGYPLWTLLARVAAAIPVSSLAWRVNALSALLAAAAVGLLYLLARRIGAGRFGASIAALLFGASIPLWRVAVEAEVYGLAIVAFLLLLLAARHAAAARSAGPRADALFFFVAGLAFLAHQTLAAPALVLAVWVLRRGVTWPRAARAIAFTVAGLSPALVVPWRAAEGASLLWKARTPLQSLADVFTRDAYGAVAQNRWRLDLVAGDLVSMGRSVAAGLGLAAIALLVVALVAERRRRGARGLRLLGAPAAAALSVPAALAMLLVFTPDAEHAAQVAPFLLPVVAVAALASGVGAAWISKRLPAPRVASAAVGAVVLLSVAPHASICDRSGFDLPERYGRELLAALPHGATLVVDGDNETFLAAYLVRHEGLRPDLTIVHRRGCVFGDANGLRGLPRAEWAARARSADLERIADPTRAVYFAAAPGDLEEAGVRFRAAGLVARALPSREAASPAAEAAAAWTPSSSWPRGTALLGGHPERYDYATRKIAISYSDAAARALLAAGDLKGAASWYEDAAAVGFDMPEAHWDVAVTAAAAGDPERALDALLAAHSLAPTRAESSSRLALFLATAGRYADAARWFERAYRNAPSAALAEDAAHAWTLAGEADRAREWSGRASEAGRVG